MTKKATRPSGDETSRKRRTRQHIIAELSVNYVERLVLKSGCVVQRPSPDYGIDLRVETFDANGNIEEEHIPLQLKATDQIEQYALAKEQCYSFPINTKDYRLWSAALTPVFFVLYDAVLEEAYWLDIQEYETKHQPSTTRKTIRIRIPFSNVLGVKTIQMMRDRKNAIVKRIRETIKGIET